MSLLRFHEIDALPLAFDLDASKTIHRAVYGFSSLARLLLLKPNEFASFLRKPCEIASETLASVSANKKVSNLLDTYGRTKFGFARVEDKNNVGGLVGLPEVLGLYETGAISSDLAVKQVGSKLVSTEGGTSIRKALKLMFERRYRRMFISGGKEFVSDRAMIGHVFSPAVLSAIAHGTDDVLAAPISEVDKMVAKEVRPDAKLAEAARALKAEKAGQCLVYDGAVVTPWDLVMKPYAGKALNIKA